MMHAPKISVVLNTARDDHPFLGRPELHCFEPLLHTLDRQTFCDFEVIIVDALFEQRDNWLAEQDYPFTIKHVPCIQNPWHSRGMPALAASHNTGLVWADGELVWQAFESNLLYEEFLGLAWNLHEGGRIPVAWYISERSDGDSSSSSYGPSHWYSQGVRPNVRYDMLGWHGERTDIEHRYGALRNDPIAPPWQWYWGYSSVPMALAERLNGYALWLDGDIAGVAPDLGSRIDLVGYGPQLVMHCNLFVVEPPVNLSWGAGVKRVHEDWKCNYGLLMYAREHHKPVANLPLPPSILRELRASVCEGCCEKPERKTEGCSKRLPRGDPTMAQYWLDAQRPWSLREQREMRRLNKPPYDRGHIYAAH